MSIHEVRIHGRGGQGAVTAAELLAVAAFQEGFWVQAFPAFGAERTGAPVAAFARISRERIKLRSQVYTPDVVLVLDDTLLHAVDVMSGLKPGGVVIVNTTGTPRDLPLSGDALLYSVPASEIAEAFLGKPIPNTAILGAYAAITGKVKLESIVEAVKRRFPGKAGELNRQAVEEAYRRASELEGYRLPPRATDEAPAPVRPGPALVLTEALVGSPATSLAYPTAGWRTLVPVFDAGKCTGCMLCMVYCPDGVVSQVGPREFVADLDFCKGCGVCAAVCPSDAIVMVRETHRQRTAAR
ncbi:MAG: pyruvate ferredoxin oxidoreductase subunit gamma [Armatimonadota bacterium]|nr:pyruvate ferredoxin oxidoreductase subunit gamma [Armatimonadota bacterium]MDR5702111.1 pyruvate ferredoxin oxidoreductase subunit gamma [Armatimonadota bacterium]MDR7434160.1 pyruvate ferredoxin oxidoreductase subunit gamma [Armatimonadota bacterium]